jgi:cytochrome bd-type quinol oxidase subunit 2
MILACYVVTGFGAAAVYAVGMLRGKRDDYHRKGLLLGMAIGFSAIPFQIVSGDLNARSIETLQPPKYAAMEGVLHSGYGLPLYIGGFVDEQTGQIYYAIQIPHGESLISHFDLNSFTRGLDSFPPDQRPPLAAFVHLSFDGMVACSFFMLFVGALFWLLYLRRKRVIPEKKWLLWCTAIAGPCAFLAMELGWMVTEEGGQIRVRNGAIPVALLHPWLTPFALVIGAMALALCATIAPTYLTVEAQRAKNAKLENAFRTRAFIGGSFLAALGIVGLAFAPSEAPLLWGGMLDHALWAVVVTMLIGLATAAALFFKRFRLARALIALETGAFLGTWGLAQLPYIIPPDLTLTNAASPPATLWAFFTTALIGMLVLIPSLWVLFHVFKEQQLVPPVHEKEVPGV